MTALTIPREDARLYNASLEDWLPVKARILAAQGDIRAERLCLAWRRYRAWRELDDWKVFVELRREFEARNK